MAEKEFGKYAKMGPYHWRETSRNVFRYNAYLDARYRIVIQFLKEVLPATESGQRARVLDFGCGDGVLSYFLWQAGYKVVGIDSSALGIQFAQENNASRGSDAEFFLNSGYDTQFAEQEFDAVVCCDVIEHVQEPDKLISEIHRITRTDGTNIYSTPIRIDYQPIDEEHVQEFFVEELEALLDTHYEAVEMKVSHPVFWYEAYSRNRHLRRSINAMSLLGKNPFYTNEKYKLYHMQYGICTV